MALTAAQAAQQSLNLCTAMDTALRTGQPVSDVQFKQTITQALILLAEAALGSGPTTSTIEAGIANQGNASTTTPVSQRNR